MKQTNVNPIIDTGLEMSVSFSVPSDVIVGILFNFLHEKDEKVGLQKLPVSNIPEEIREADPSLRDKPTHQLTSKLGFVQIGERVLCIGGIMPYITWANFESYIKDIIGFLSNKGLVRNVELVKLRYLNFFKENIFNSINLTIQMQGIDELCNGSTVFRTQLPCGSGILGVLQITNGVHVKNTHLNMDDDGSLIDIQTVSKQVSMSKLSEVITQLHEQAENLFNKLTKKGDCYE